MNASNADSPRPFQRRRYAPKAKSGCLTCKIRRVKCDESKPSCKRCTSTGRKCDGYGGNYTASAATTTAAPLGTVQTALTIDVASGHLERRTFDFFRLKTVPGISGYFSDAAWNCIALQISHSQPAVRYAINALGALHEEIVLQRKASQAGLAVAVVECRTGFPRMQYTKAIGEVRKLLESGEVELEVILLCAMAFMHFEALHEAFLPALVHLENAIKLLKARQDSGGKKVNEDIVQAIQRLDLQSSVYLGMRVPGSVHYGAPSELPSCFQTLAQARDIIATWTCRLLRFIRTEAEEGKLRKPGSIPLETYAKAQSFEKTALELDRLLLCFMQNTADELTVREQQGLHMLRSRVKVDRITAAICLYTEESAIDRFQDELEDIVTLCQRTIHSEDLDDYLYSAAIDEGLVSPLWFVTARCRDSRIRHRALDLFKAIPAREGIWYMEVMTKFSETLTEYEEALCEMDSPTCHDIPEWRRVHSSGISGWDIAARSTAVNFTLRTRPNGMDGEWCDVRVPMQFSLDTHPNRNGEYNSYGLLAATVALPSREPFATPMNDTLGPPSALGAEPYMYNLPYLTSDAPHILNR